MCTVASYQELTRILQFCQTIKQISYINDSDLYFCSAIFIKKISEFSNKALKANTTKEKKNLSHIDSSVLSTTTHRVYPKT